VLVVEVERLVIVVDLRQIGVGENLGENAPLRTHLWLELAAARTLPSAVPTLLVFPITRITDTGFGFDVVEPSVLNAFAAGPNVLAGHRASVTPDALVQVEDHADLSADFHWPASALLSGWSIQSTFFILRTMTNSSRLAPTVP